MRSHSERSWSGVRAEEDLREKDYNSTEDAQRQYISEWQDSFVNHIGELWSTVKILMNHPSATERDRTGFDQIKILLHGRDAQEMERRLDEADVMQDILDRIEKLNKDLVDIAVEHLETRNNCGFRLRAAGGRLRGMKGHPYRFEGFVK